MEEKIIMMATEENRYSAPPDIQQEKKSTQNAIKSNLVSGLGPFFCKLGESAI